MKTLKILLTTIILSVIVSGCTVNGDYEYECLAVKTEDLPKAYSNVIHEIESRGFLVVKIYTTSNIDGTYIVGGGGLNFERFCKMYSRK